jgi:hypothetical protein
VFVSIHLKFEAWEGTAFAPEADFLAAVGAIEGIATAETQAYYALASMSEDASTMASPITHTPAAEVTAEYKEIAAAWPVWDSRAHPQKPAKSGKFPFDCNGGYATERILITKGSAALTPTDGSPQVSTGAGDSVFFHRGFACEWEVHKPVLKHCAYYGEDGEEMPAPPGITCDICSADCWASSYLLIDGEGTELDLCPKCFKKGSKKYSGAEHQCGGEPAPLPQKKKRKR